MKRSDFKSMSADELWMLHEEITAELAAKIHAEKKAIENRLRLLGNFASSKTLESLNAVRTQLFFRNSEIRPSRRKRGPVAGSSHAG